MDDAASAVTGGIEIHPGDDHAPWVEFTLGQCLEDTCRGRVPAQSQELADVKIIAVAIQREWVDDAVGLRQDRLLLERRLVDLHDLRLLWRHIVVTVRNGD